MIFNSLQFLIFFVIVLILFFKTPHKYRWIILLAASIYFYMSWNAKYIILLLISTSIDYFVALALNRTENKNSRKWLLSISIFSNLGILFAFKYFNFFIDSFKSLSDSLNLGLQLPILNVILPVGISFYTFQALSYTIDVYKKEIKVEKHFGIFALFITFFPQLVAGPIERAKNLLPQFYIVQKFDYDRAINGLILMMWGFFKKIVIADRVAVLVNAVYNSPTEYTGIPLILATVLFAFQIYCDFSGYSDIAIGCARIMGFNLMSNFKRPYFATSISDFWKRWHISLSTWFRDYLYIPLGGNRVKVSRLYVNLMIVFIISGLWHGANWTFVLWGALHGFYLVFGMISRNFRAKIANLWISKYPKIHYFFKIAVIFIIADFSWIFFRSNSMSDAIYIITHMFSGITFNTSGLDLGGIGMNGLLTALFFILMMEVVHLLQERTSVIKYLRSKSIVVKWSLCIVLLMIILLFGVFESTEFIYFQF